MISKTFLAVDDVGIINIFLDPTLIAIPPVITIKFKKGTSSAKNNGKAVLLEGDEKNFECIPPTIVYTAPPFIQPGTLELEEIILDSSHYSDYATDNNKKLLIAGSAPFTAKFKVKTKAAIPPIPPKPDPTFDPRPVYIGKGNCIPAGINFHEGN
ncbi:hypothetical protein [Silvanigrella aquatica]|uniref:Uncharacterized protein n=1 Tax=Silvanigrella aquatica TaxID=1915309 RepID=A0A1L4D2Q1_9BACT|nr:hypothetical protein [Silvanigrella aquatica]APJ04476.1 hypothetical protein AXG55_11375 [Silvanigrella aquatica]